MATLRYFLYIAFNWNLRLAFFIIRYEMKGEKKYGIDTIGIDELKVGLPADRRKHASIYQPVNYYSADKLFHELYLEDIEGALLDLGCGKGRIFAVGASFGFKEIIGIDFSEKLCIDARLTAEKVMKKNPNVNATVVYEDAASYVIPAKVSTIFLFNPFDEIIMAEVIKNINKSQQSFPRPLKILYANPVCKKLFEEAGFIETAYFQKLVYLEGSVLEREAV